MSQSFLVRYDLKNHVDLAPKISIYYVLFGFEILSKQIEHLALLCLDGISVVHEMNHDPVDYTFIFRNAAHQLNQELVLSFPPHRMAKDPLYSDQNCSGHSRHLSKGYFYT